MSKKGLVVAVFCGIGFGLRPREGKLFVLDRFRHTSWRGLAECPGEVKLIITDTFSCSSQRGLAVCPE